MNASQLQNRAVSRALIAGAGLAALAAAVLRYPGPPDLSWDPAVLPLAALGVACLGIATALGTDWQPAALLGGLYLLAQASGLQLVDPERYANYAHYAEPSALGARWIFLAPIALQWALGIRALRSMRLQWPRIGWWRPALVLAVLAFGVAVPTRSAGRYATESLLALAVTLGGLLNLWLFARALPAAGLERIRRAVARRLVLDPDVDTPGRWDRRLPWVAAGLATVAAAAFARLVLEGVPHIDDSISNLFQARTLAHGRLALPAPPDSAAFHVVEVLNHDGRWFGYGFPGWPAVLSLGVRAGTPWLVNPLLAGVTVLLAHRLLVRLHGRATANPVTILLVTSPWLLFMSAEMMGHPLSLVLALITLLGVARGRESGTRGAVLAGLALGALALTRPLDAGIVAFTVLIWLIRDGLGARPRERARAARATLRVLLPLGIAAAAVGSLLPLYNRALTGDPFYTPQMMWTDRAWGPGSDRYGFGPDVGIRAWPAIDPLPGHGPADVVLNLNKNLFAAGTDLLGWPGASLALVLVAFALGHRRGRLETALLLATVIGYSGYWFAGGPDLGPRYWYIALPAFLALSVAGARTLATLWDGRRVAAAIALAAIAANLTFVPWRAATRYYRYRDIGGEIRRLARENDWGNALVLVRSQEREAYQAAFNFLDPAFPPGAAVFARDTGPDSRDALIRAFPDRPVWVIAPDSGRDTRLRVLAGPLPPGTAVR